MFPVVNTHKSALDISYTEMPYREVSYVTAERVKAVIAGQFDIDEAALSDDLTFEELGADVLDVAELIAALSDEFDVEISEECADGIVTIGDAVSCVKKYLRSGR